MKIVILDAYNARVEVLSVSDELIARYDDDVEKFLMEHDYNLNNIEWMATDAKDVPVTYHVYDATVHVDTKGNCSDTEFHDTHNGTLHAMFLTEDFVEEKVRSIKKIEQDKLRGHLLKWGTPTDDGGFKYEWKNGDGPVCAAYLWDKPTDVIVHSVKMDKDGYLSMMVEEEGVSGPLQEVEANDFFAGQVDYLYFGIG